MHESDWKLFRKSIEGWRERYLAKINKELIIDLANPDATPSETFWKTYEKINQIGKILQDSFDGLSRSRMKLAIFLMLGQGVITLEDIQPFSEDLQQQAEEFLKDIPS